MEIYLDNSATTKPYKEVIDKMVYALDTDYANPSSLHRKGVEVEKNIKNIRQSIARTLGAKDKEIYFTSGVTESNNTIIRGIVALNKKRKNHIISKPFSAAPLPSSWFWCSRRPSTCWW